LDAFAEESTRLTSAVGHIANNVSTESTLRQRLEQELETSCRALGLPWAPFELDRRVGRGRTIRFVDVAHGGVVIEYEKPRSFRGRQNARLLTARAQAEEYAQLLSTEEGRPLADYTLVAWDGTHIDFGRHTSEGPTWQGLVPFDEVASGNLLRAHADRGMPLVHPLLIAALAGPQTELGTEFIGLLFDRLVVPEPSARTNLLFSEWRRLFGQAAGVQSDRLRAFLAEQGALSGRNYAEAPAAFLFALYTYVALVAKVVAALALSGASQNIADDAATIDQRLGALEGGELFTSAGITNMLEADFFSWYLNDDGWLDFRTPAREVISVLRAMNFDIGAKDPSSTRDLFKGLYQSFVPGALRHALGEFYTPDVLAAHALDVLKWEPTDDLLDPTCGSGTFLLEALRRRREHFGTAGGDATELLRGIAGFDLNPLAVLCARASLVVFLADRFSPARPTYLPVYLADAVTPAVAVEGVITHELQTEKGRRTFSLPESLVHRQDQVLAFFRNTRQRLEQGASADLILDRVTDGMAIDEHERCALRSIITTLADLRDEGWDGIWCAILAERFAASALGAFTHIAGNPPWVKWSNLPPEYADLIKPTCQELGVFSDATWVGGIESDISIVITFESVRSRLKEGGQLAFYITGTVFQNESSQGFRRFRVPDTSVTMKVLGVEDFSALRPFDDVSNHPALLVLERGRPTEYPVPYVRWLHSEPDGRPSVRDELLAAPIPGSEDGPWLIGTEEDVEAWTHLFGNVHPKFEARKGITTDLNGVFWVRPGAFDLASGLIRVTNDPSLGRKPGLSTVTELVETDNVYPLLRGKDVSRFRAVPQSSPMLLCPQRGMHGDPDLLESSPNTYRFLSNFFETLARRSSLRRYQPKQPIWSLWNVGAYSFADYKVVWKEIRGHRFHAAYVGPLDVEGLGRKTVLCDHKLYVVACDTEAEAAYLTAFLNAPLVSSAVSAYAARLSLGSGPVKYLDIPPFDPADPAHRDLSDLGRDLSTGTRPLDEASDAALDHCVARVVGSVPPEISPAVDTSS
jgi:hypothetical protein